MAWVPRMRKALGNAPGKTPGSVWKTTSLSTPAWTISCSLRKGPPGGREAGSSIEGRTGRPATSIVISGAGTPSARSSYRPGRPPQTRTSARLPIAISSTGAGTGSWKVMPSCAIWCIADSPRRPVICRRRALNAVAATRRQRCTSPGRSRSVGLTAPLTAKTEGTAVTQSPEVKAGTLPSWILSSLMQATMSAAALTSGTSSTSPSTMITPAMPPAICSAVAPCRCGWYQYVPAGWPAGTWMVEV